MATVTEAPAVSWTTVDDLLKQLGGIDPVRVLMKPLPGTATEADLIAANAKKPGICELVDGVLVEKGMGYVESNLAMYLGGLLNAFIIPRNLGIVSGPDGMMRLFPGLVREPDIAFASWDPDPRTTTTHSTDRRIRAGPGGRNIEPEQHQVRDGPKTSRIFRGRRPNRLAGRHEEADRRRA